MHFGSLEVLTKEKVEVAGIVWACVCSCGVLTRVRASRLILGQVTSCKGCSRGKLFPTAYEWHKAYNKLKPEVRKKSSEKARKELRKGYCLNLITQGTNLSRRLVPPLAIELKRKLLTIHRLTRAQSDTAKHQ
jgi:hypothetical protein